MTNQSGGGGTSGAASGDLTGTYPAPTLTGHNVPQELGYVQTAVSQASIGTSLTDITGLTLSVTVGTRPIVLEAVLPTISTSASNAIAVIAIIDTTSGATQLISGAIQTGVAGNGFMLRTAVRINPAAGVRSYKVQALVSSGTLTTNAGATNPAWFQIREV